MKMFKKLYLTLSGSMHTVVDRLQNHEALAVASLSELEDRIHAARVATASLARGLKSTEEETASTEREAVQWRTRARHQGESGDRETALQCLHRARTLDQRAHALHRQRTTSQAAHERLQQTLSEMQSTHSTTLSFPGRRPIRWQHSIAGRTPWVAHTNSRRSTRLKRSASSVSIECS